MRAPNLTDEEFAAEWKRYGNSPTAMARATGRNVASIYQRRNRLAARGMTLPTAPSNGTATNRGTNGFGRSSWQIEPEPYTPIANETVKDGCVVVFSDAHWWPGRISLAHKALLVLLKRLQPKLIVANGDVFDGANISRHDPLGWQKLPTVVEELDTVKLRLSEIERAAPKAKRRLTVGNHDSRFDRRLAAETAEFGGVEGFRLQDHLKAWPMSYVVNINDATLVMHNFRGGVHATWNNAIHSGAECIVTGHHHSQDRKSHTDWYRNKYGVDAGCLADTDGPQFSYGMGRPANHRSGFAVLTYDKQGRLFPPELLEVQRLKSGYRAVFRGEIICES